MLANTLYDILDDSSDVAKAAAKRRTFSGGDAGEEFLKEMFGGRQQAYFKTSQGRRFVDQLAGRTAHESKVGYVATTDFIKKQAAKDAELLATKQVDEVSEPEWRAYGIKSNSHGHLWCNNNNWRCIGDEESPHCEGNSITVHLAVGRQFALNCLPTERIS